MELLPEEVGKSFYEDIKDKNNIIELPKNIYNAKSKKIFINRSLYFTNVLPEVWEYKIGGYQVLDKYLKSHKDEMIDIEYFSKIIKTLHESLQLESEIAKCSW
ncbi:type ISP restriction/modification enzyme [Helicobacter sp. 11S03491-1]|uniref:type ISP restriction/modification enzyme n=1 Tax=Helicobacter sp. 11S03491-1 TaxID=1476196 RepID=UPI002151DE5C|nr:type ISP restriction/modification enzyme [Helicobacter sp. 11S03491-1]